MTASRFDLTLEEGADYALTLTYYDSSGALVDLTGATAKLQIKDEIGSSALVSLTQASGITLGGTAGTISIAITVAQVAALGANFEGLYDLKLTLSSLVTRLLQGAVYVSPQVSI